MKPTSNGSVDDPFRVTRLLQHQVVQEDKAADHEEDLKREVGRLKKDVRAQRAQIVAQAESNAEK